ncbi:hypothetical protein ACUV84_029963 [Puccinellia chinampoensis]
MQSAIAGEELHRAQGQRGRRAPRPPAVLWLAVAAPRVAGSPSAAESAVAGAVQIFFGRLLPSYPGYLAAVLLFYLGYLAAASAVLPASSSTAPSSPISVVASPEQVPGPEYKLVQTSDSRHR